MATEIPYVPVAGLRVPATLVPRIIASMRGIYPNLTVGLDDEAAVRAVLRYWVTSTLATYEGQQSDEETLAAIEAIQAQADEKARLAREKAIRDAAAIVDAASATTTPTTTP